MLSQVFDSQGKRFGVYVEETKEGFNFEIRGSLESTLLSLPLSDDYLIEAFRLDNEYQDIFKEVEVIRERMKTKSALHLQVLILH